MDRSRLRIDVRTPEVTDANIETVVYKYIFGFDVAMDYTSSVDSSKPSCLELK